MTDLAHKVRCDGQRVVATVCQPEHDECIGEPSDTEADAARATRILCLLGKREPRCVNYVVELPHGNPHRICKAAEINPRLRRKRRQNEARQIERTQIAGPIRRQWDLAAWIGGANPLPVLEIIELVDAIDEQDTGLSAVVCSTQDEVPELTGADMSDHTT